MLTGVSFTIPFSGAMLVSWRVTVSSLASKIGSYFKVLSSPPSLT